MPKQFSFWEFFKNIEQKNGRESFRPPISQLPENFFYGNCCSNTMSEFYQESKIRFQMHQDENNIADIKVQEMLLRNHKFCDIDYSKIQMERCEERNEHNTDSYESEEADKKSSISMLEI